MKKIKLLLNILICLLILLPTISSRIVEEIPEESPPLIFNVVEEYNKEINPTIPKDTNLKLGPLNLIIFFSFILILSVILLIIFRKKLNLIWVIIGGLIGGLYALIFGLLFFDIGEGGMIAYFIPSIWPVGLTLIVIISIYGISRHLINIPIITQIQILAYIINIIFWVIVGAYLGYIIKKKKGKWIIGFSIGAIAMSTIGAILTYLLLLLEFYRYSLYLLLTIHTFPLMNIVILFVVGGLIGIWKYGKRNFWLYIVIGGILGAINSLLLLPFFICIFLIERKKKK